MEFRAVQYEEYPWHRLKSAYNILQDAHKFGVLKFVGKVNQNMKFEAADITGLIDD